MFYTLDELRIERRYALFVLKLHHSVFETFKEFLVDTSKRPDYQKLSEMNYSLPAVEYTDKQVDWMMEGTSLQISFFLLLLGNMIADSGILHGKTIKTLSKKLDCDRSCFYGEGNLIDAINASGLATLYRKNQKIYGRIHTPPKKRGKKNPLYKLSVSMIHRICLQGVLTLTKSKAVLRMLLMLSMHCDLRTGEINTEKRASEWAEMINVSRTAAERAIDWINAHGFAQLERDYIVTGRLNYTAMAKGYLTVFAEKQKELNAQAKADREAGYPDYKAIEQKLYKFFGLNARAWMQHQIHEAGKYLLKGIMTDFDKVWRKDRGVQQGGTQPITAFV